MTVGRLWTVARLDLRESAKRPLFWIWLGILALLTWELSSGDVRISSGDSTVGGTKAFITSQFANAQLTAMFVTIFYAFFIAVGAGMSILRDEECKVGSVLHATPLRPREYVWGKYLAMLAAFLVVLAIDITLSIVFNHVLTGAEEAEFIGPFTVAGYLWPAAVFALPPILFLSGMSFAVGELTRRPILVFLIPVTLLILCAFFLWQFTPTWLDPRIDRLLMWVDPSGFRWLNETYLKVDRGVEFYNSAPLALDAPFAISRVLFAAVGLLGVAWSRRHFERTLRGRPGMPKAKRWSRKPQTAGAPPLLNAPLARLGMRSRPRGFTSALIQVTRAELRELRGHPGLYLFIPIVVLQTVGNSTFALGAFQTPLLHTPGALSVRALGWLTTMTCFLLLFYVVESLRREKDVGVASIGYAAPIPTSALLLGKLLANGLAPAATIGVTLATFLIVLTVQGDVVVDPMPFLIVWGVCLVPTLLLFGAFVTFLFSLTGSRYTTYALGLGVMAWTGFELAWGNVTWVTNWPLWGAMQWSDMGIFELDRRALLLNRGLALSAAVFFLVFAVRLFPRRAWDSTCTLVRLRPRGLLNTALRLSPWAATPMVCAILLSIGIDAGFQGDASEERAKDYWRKNVATWTDAPNPDVTRADVSLEIEPAERWLRVDGTFELANRHDEPLRRIALTAGDHWEDPVWTMNGEEYEPDDRAGLFVFTPPDPLRTEERVTVGFAFEGRFPNGMTSNGGGVGEFILPSGVVLTSFSPTFVPIVGYNPSIGVDEDNQYDSKEFAPDHYEGLTRSFTGGGPPFPVRIQVTAPAEYTMNSVGTLVSDEEADGRRTVVWETEEPVGFFNVVGGRWAVARGEENTAIYYHPTHDYNIDEMLRALDGARKHYSEWFYPYPWNELKLSEFPALAGYAQGFATNIPFSENLGFLTKSDPKINAAFLVTAHESAHQWWANILTPGEGPGGNLLSEGTAHFSTILLHEAELGLRERIEFCKRLEEQYGQQRQDDSERPLVEIDGTRPGDTTVTYDKAGWVYWMLLQHMGREENLAGIRSFIRHYREDPDFPVLQDFVAHLRPFARDAEAYDAFCAQWFFDVVLPKYDLDEVTSTQLADGPRGPRWEVRAIVQNKGTAHMPVEFAASRGERFPDEDDEEGDAEDAIGERGSPANELTDRTVLAAERAAPLSVSESEDESEPYLEARTTVVLGAGESAEIVILCDFEPEQLVVDPDALVLQLNRDQVVHRF